ncbi:TIGR04086 family membrane protein [Calderihabitans maritimus]|uniref:TIGR04086 family membrane protein n=1 Tax=Calderihabitans maritimus TaxID=1246530 RepID=A0A1Z5HXI6_9FIRM|nr:TIGR04086 family membrane protein [Calderihabitans maritimus]GAW94246.1 hypothetical protein Desca_1339 [Calderihabitans maritimus]
MVADGKIEIFFPVGKGLVVSLFTSTILSVTAGAVFYFTSLQENYLPSISTVILVTSTLLGGSVAAKSAGSRGLLQGMSVGTAFFILLLLLTVLAGNQMSAIVVLKKLFYCVLAGGVGGIAGISFR